MGASDLTPPPARRGPGLRATRSATSARFFTTADTVEDLEALRIALRAERLALDGISYGTFVAQRYALALPRPRERPRARLGRARRGREPALGGLDQGDAPRARARTTTEDLAKVVREQHNGPQMLDMLTGLSVGAPRGNGAANAIEAAADGNPGPLDGLHAGVLDVMQGWTRGELSQGLHASTLCADSPAPWGDASAPLEGRKQALEAAAAKLSDDDLYPYDRATATGNGIAQQCLNWPPVDVPAPERPRRPARRPDAPARRRPRPLDPDGVGAGGGEARAGRPADRSSRAPATASRARATRRRWRRCAAS